MYIKKKREREKEKEKEKLQAIDLLRVFLVQVNLAKRYIFSEN